MDRKLMAICVLTVTAIAMMIANFLPTPARADQVVSDRDYQVVTARVEGGGDAVYVLENRSGKLAILTYDMNSRSLMPRAVRPITDVFK
jgi:hypothetical protein